MLRKRAVPQALKYNSVMHRASVSAILLAISHWLLLISSGFIIHFTTCVIAFLDLPYSISN